MALNTQQLNIENRATALIVVLIMKVDFFGEDTIFNNAEHTKIFSLFPLKHLINRY